MTLRLQGTVAFPSPGYEVTLIAAAPQGINIRILELDWHEKARTGSVPDAVTWIPVRSELAMPDEFEEVHVRELGQMIEVFCVY